MKKILKGFIMSMGMFCIIPMPSKAWDEESANMVMPTFPLVGVVVGGFWTVFAWGLTFLDFKFLFIALIMVFPYVFSGFIHLDGFMDTSDAILSRRDVEEKRRILKDSHTGAFAVIMLVILFLLAFSAVQDIFPDRRKLLMLLPISILSRCGSAFSLLGLKSIAKSGYGYLFKQNAAKRHMGFVMILVLTALILSFFILQISGLAIMGIEALGYALAMFWAYCSLDGVSGDLAGFSMVIGELAGLMSLAMI